MYLCGDAEVVRVSVAVNPGSCGAACHIHSYRVLPDAESLNLDQALAAMTENDHQ